MHRVPGSNPGGETNSLLDMETLIMTLDQIYCRGYDAAMSGSMTIDDCPYRDWEWEEKRAWVLGFIEGLRTLWY